MPKVFDLWLVCKLAVYDLFRENGSFPPLLGFLGQKLIQYHFYGGFCMNS